jgi:hypothetical protein
MKQGQVSRTVSSAGITQGSRSGNRHFKGSRRKSTLPARQGFGVNQKGI